MSETDAPKKRGRPKDKLTPKQQKFIAAYLATGNATQSYRKAYNAKGMSDNASRVEAQKLLNHPAISLALLSSQKRVAERSEITAMDLVRELEEVQNLALADGQYAPVVAAIHLKAKILGKITNKVQGSVEHHHEHNHRAEPLSESAGWVEGLLGAGSEGKAAQPTAH
jgi:phage terminase small subunit